MEWLLSSGASPNSINKKLNTPMHFAFKSQKIDVISILKIFITFIKLYYIFLIGSHVINKLRR